ncbi:hypothetical protein [Nonomuraea dietziae]|uniref:hypothetical protein n=1 Tax=Nonomuraea dietziae TaxID=65515 RepID=UPI0031D5ABBE
MADGDTGTNLHLTMLSAPTAVEALPDDMCAAVVWQTMAYGALVGARGNWASSSARRSGGWPR